MLRETNFEPVEPFVQSASGTLAARSSQAAEVILDLSRLLSRVLHPSPTGIDRVEMAYARGLKRLIPDRLQFGAVHPTGFYGRLATAHVEAFLDRTEERWEKVGGSEPAGRTRMLGLSHCWSLRPQPVPRTDGARVVLQVSPHHLQHPTVVARKLHRERARFICMVHDLIPITHPEYARTNGLDRHRRRLRTIETYAAGILANSQSTLDMLLGQSADRFGDRPRRVARLGVDARRPADATAFSSEKPYFLCVSTIEPRKNHLLLLHIWRSLVDALGPNQAPLLYLVGRRGWENENILDLLDRCPGLAGVVREMPRLPDMQLRALMRGARAVLMPSFAEGYGMPVAEALASGVPVLASDIPAHREAGGTAADYIDPVDGVSWRSAILDYLAPASVRRAAQMRRLARWSPIAWETHLATALGLVDEVAAC